MFEIFKKKERPKVQDEQVDYDEIERKKQEAADDLDDDKTEEERQRADEHYEDMNRMFPHPKQDWDEALKDSGKEK